MNLARRRHLIRFLFVIVFVTGLYQSLFEQLRSQSCTVFATYWTNAGCWGISVGPSETTVFCADAGDCALYQGCVYDVEYSGCAFNGY